MNAPVPEDTEDSTPRLEVIRKKDWAEDGEIVIWIHSEIPPLTIYDEVFPTFVSGDDDKETLRTFSSFVSPDQIDAETWIDPHEAQRRLRAKHGYRQFYANKKTKKLPEAYVGVSAIHRARNYVAERVIVGEFGLDTVIFKFSYKDDRGQDMVHTLTAGEFCGFVKHDDWKKDYKAIRAKSLFLVVNEADPGKGLQIFIGPASLSGGRPPKDAKVYKPINGFSYSKIYAAINAEVSRVSKKNENIRARNPEKTDEELGLMDPNDFDPQVKPYPIRITYNANAAEAANMYTVTPLLTEMLEGAYELTPEIKAGIEQDVDSSDLAFHLEDSEYGYTRMRESMERASKEAGSNLPIDSFFAPWAKKLGLEDLADESTEHLCSCGLICDSSWSHCPNCDAELTGGLTPPTLEEMVFDDSGEQVCLECGERCTLDAGTCHACNTQLPVQTLDDDLEGDDFSDLDDEG